MPAIAPCCLMNLTKPCNGSTKASSQMPRSPNVPQPRRSTLVDSTTTRPAPPAANLPAFIRCQSVGKPFTAEYWCIGGTTIRLRNVTSRMENGVNSSVSDIGRFPQASVIPVATNDIERGESGKAGKSGAAQAASPPSHAILGWREGTGSDRRESNNSRTTVGGDAMNEAIRPARNVELGASNEPFQNLHEFVRKARANLNQNAWDYIVGAAETETTMRRN